MTDVAEREMPKFKCHKTVRALKIDDVIPHDFTLTFGPRGKPEFGALRLSREWFEKHNPQPGGYYVVYEDGYASYSPAKAFEEGYSPLTVETPVTGHEFESLKKKLAAFETVLDVKIDELSKWQRYASYCCSCALSGESNPFTFEGFIKRAESQAGRVPGPPNPPIPPCPRPVG